MTGRKKKRYKRKENETGLSWGGHLVSTLIQPSFNSQKL